LLVDGAAGEIPGEGFLSLVEGLERFAEGFGRLDVF
jgi:hypothetical protein